MKHIHFLKVSLLFISLFVAMNLKAQDFYFTVDIFKYRTSSAEPGFVYIVSNGYTGNLNIPATVLHNGTQYSVVGIGMQAFFNRVGVTSVTVPNSVTKILGSAFSGCSGLTSIILSNKLTEIGAYCFEYTGALNSITSLNPVPPSIGTQAFVSINFQTCNVYVPVGSVQTYKNAPGWNQFSNINEINASSVDKSAENSVKVYSESGYAIVKGVTYGENINVYTIDGVQIKSVKSQNKIVKVKLPENQTYVIRVKEKAYKIINNR